MPKIRLLGKTYNVNFIKPTEELENKFTGRINYDTGEVTVALRESPRSTALHEMLHVINTYLGCGVDVEDNLERFEIGIMHLLRDNKDFTRWLLEEDDVKKYDWRCK